MVIQQYQDPSVNRRLKFGFWYTENKYLFYKILIGVLIGISAIVWICLIFLVVKIVFLEPNQNYLYTDLALQRSPVFEIHQKQSPKPLIIVTSDVVPSSSEISNSNLTVKSADFVAIVENPNINWFLEIDYKFSYLGGETELKKGFILPSQKQALTSFGVSVNGLPSAPKFEIVNSSWNRIKDQEKLNRAKDMQNAISFSDLNIVNNGKSAIVSYTVFNSSIYTIVDPVFVVALSNFNGEILAAGINKALEIPANGSIELEKRWLHSLSSQSNINVYLIINFLDDSIYRIPSSDVKIKF